ncbi:MAG: hypothetical protein AAGI90_04255 [Chlamydiota bacterium]
MIVQLPAEGRSSRATHALVRPVEQTKVSTVIKIAKLFFDWNCNVIAKFILNFTSYKHCLDALISYQETFNQSIVSLLEETMVRKITQFFRQCIGRRNRPRIPEIVKQVLQTQWEPGKFVPKNPNALDTRLNIVCNAYKKADQDTPYRGRFIHYQTNRAEKRREQEEEKEVSRGADIVVRKEQLPNRRVEVPKRVIQSIVDSSKINEKLLIQAIEDQERLRNKSSVSLPRRVGEESVVARTSLPRKVPVKNTPKAVRNVPHQKRVARKKQKKRKNPINARLQPKLTIEEEQEIVKRIQAEQADQREARKTREESTLMSYLLPRY